ncbi:hypothetical protein ABK040_001270 [Willaertia magna]
MSKDEEATFSEVQINGEQEDNKLSTQLEEMMEEQTKLNQSNSFFGRIKSYFIEEFGSKSLSLFYLSHLLSSWGDRMWAFALPIIFADMYPSTLLPMALFGFIHRLFCIILGPQMGHIVDTKPRLKVMTISLIIQNVAVAITTVILFFLAYSTTNEQKQNNNQQQQETTQELFVWPFKSALSIILFFSSALFGAISELSSMVSSIARNKDWCIVIAKNEKRQLAGVNAMMRRLDMISLILSPVIYGTVVTTTSYQIGMFVVTAWNVVSVVPEFLIILSVYNVTPLLKVPKQQQQKEEQKEEEKEEKETPTLEEKEIELTDKEGQVEKEEEKLEITEQSMENKEQVETTKQSQPNLKHKNIFIVLYNGWKLYLKQRVLLSSIAFVLLYITVLHHGGLLLSYLKSYKVESWVLGLFQALSAISGFSSTFLAPYLISKFKVFIGGLIGIYLQFTCLFIGVIFFILFHFWNENFFFAIYIFLGSIVLSRLGLYTFDLAEIQIMQECIDPNESGIVNATESSLTKVADLIVFGSALILSTPPQFIGLAIGSLACVGLAALLYTIWFIRNKKFMNKMLEKQKEEQLQ